MAELEHLIARVEGTGAPRKIFGAHHRSSTATLNNYRERCLISASDGDGLSLFVEIAASLTSRHTPNPLLAHFEFHASSIR
jgi:hypothetical protein